MPHSGDSVDHELNSVLDTYHRDLVRKVRKRRRRYADIELELDQHRKDSAQLERLAARLDEAIRSTWETRDLVHKALSRAGVVREQEGQDERSET
jgi:hypothetical protein